MPARRPGGAGRVIAGTARGRPLAAPGDGTRPLGDRVKQSLFAILEPALRSRPFLDLYAGSGAAGIEAMSRGASRAVFIENDRRARAVITENLEATALRGESVEVLDWDVAAWLAREAGRIHRGEVATDPFAVVFADPPYDTPAELDLTLAGIAEAGPGAILATDGLLVAKHFWRTPPAAEIGLLRSVREARFGDTVLTFYRWAGQEDG